MLVDFHPRHERLRQAAERRIREELAKLQVEVNEEKSRGESFGFLGFDFRRVRSRAGRWTAQRLPQMRKRTELLRKLKAIFPRYRSRVDLELISEINPVGCRNSAEPQLVASADLAPPREWSPWPRSTRCTSSSHHSLGG